MMRTKAVKLSALLAGVIAVCASSATAQEAINTIAPTQPAVGGVVTKTQARITLYGGDPTGRGREGVEYVLWNEAIVGITPRFSASLGVPLIRRELEGDSGDDSLNRGGLGDAVLTLKYRFWQQDPGPVDTRRLAAFVGLEMPTGHSDLTSDSWDPTAGLVYMGIHGRHGFNQSVAWTFTTGDVDAPIGPGDSLADLLSFDSAYLYRISPDEYTADLTASLYGVLELNGSYETNGDLEILLSPGLLYEAANFAIEAGIQVPIFSDIEERMRMDIGIRLGLRILF
ncbi:MAG: transporter [Phycisphaerales bacterium]